MSCTAQHGIAQSFPHRWCTRVGRTVLVVGMIPALFGGGANVTVLALAAFAALGLLMVVGALRAARSAPKHPLRPVRAAVALTTDVLVLLIAAGLVLGAQLGGGSGAVLFSSGGLVTMAGFLALCTVHHFAHRRSHRRPRRY
ncbi:hypothetical protein OG883_44215 [Streptomyces sp. NBC_01142]|uniref:hypothetical protein n=1 Tax=Streptomyces sp. NBC_01142 TaxID=2975865 RepID=UPI00225BE78A|nr:hypothetical protein [Streptomyces sp. NBC_01142]MCX4826649.1 hypothetical protein [Streptomyces sp. NBC_01142]